MPTLLLKIFSMRDYCLKNNTLRKEEVLGLFRTIPLMSKWIRANMKGLKWQKRMML